MIDAVRTATKDIPQEIGRQLTEETGKDFIDESFRIEKEKKAAISGISDSLGNLTRGAGRFADPSRGENYGKGESALDTATEFATSQLEIKDNNNSLWGYFFRQTDLLPTGNGCSDFKFFEGDVYQVTISCDRLSSIKTMLTWVMTLSTIWYVFVSLTSLLRKGGE
ncbi:hypothetical protein AM380_17035 [Morganella morganii]|uniref:Uncharacterized protein n=1 Tax=Morganella morganii TaxID=582 RepID=A0AAU8ZQ40_MORMO|nr:hypothetical protein AM380_16965 [Morganella morganii]AWC95220.1 hypothetical protein AM380_17035 [Morganella morganii]